jgi:hypothetical protein
VGFPAGEGSVKKIKDVKPAAEIVAEMMPEAREILEGELLAGGYVVLGSGPG